MKLLSLCLIFLMSFTTIRSIRAQDDQPILQLGVEEAWKTFTLETGTIIEVSLPYGDLYLSYEPSKLQFLDHTPLYPELSTEEPELVPPPPIDPQETIPSEIATAEPSEGFGVATAGAATVAVSSDEMVWVWRFLAIGAGETTLALESLNPPCPKDELCPMMPDFMTSFNLVIKGDTIVPEPESVEGEIIEITPRPSEEQTINVQPGQIILLNIPEPPSRVIYHPLALRLLAGETPRFLVESWGMRTRVGVQLSDETLLAATLLIEPMCDSCGVKFEDPTSP